MEGDVPVRPEGASIPLAASTVPISTRRVSLGGAEEDGDTCRICRGEGTIEQPLFFPCKCSGSIRFVHQECLMEWLAHSQKQYCELCKTPFTFTKLYDQSMPSTLPLALFLQQIIVHCGAALLRNTRYVLVTMVWLCWLPWSIRQVWRGLFWLADGSWVSTTRLQEAALSQMALVNATNVAAMLENTNIPSQSLADEVMSVQGQMQASLFSGFVGLFTGDFLLFELVRFVFPGLSRWSQDIVSSDAADDPVILLTMDRQPSLLSNVKFLSSLTRYRLLNGALVDVFEGQLICLLIVVAFILVFLIREWVINQQPIINMPDPDNAVEAPRQMNAPDEDRRAVRRRQRQLLRLQAQAEGQQRGDDPPMALAQPLGANVAALRAHHHLQDTHGADLYRPSNGPGEHAENVTEVHGEARSLTRHPDDMVLTPGNSEAANDDLNARPPLPARGALDEMANIQRSLEERLQNDLTLRSDINHETTVVAEPLQIDSDVGGKPPTYSPTHSNSSFGTNLMEDLGSDIRHSSTQPKSADVSQPEPHLDLPDIRPPGNRNQLLQHAQNSISPTSETDSTSNMGGDTIIGDTASAASAPIETPGTTSDESSIAEGDLLNAAVEDRSIWSRVSGWFWHLDESIQDQQLAEPNIEEDAQDEDDNNAANEAGIEAPLVPANNRDMVAVNVQGDVPAAPPVQEPNVMFGVDLNNPDAAEDAEDLDGILELIGMQGPLVGMIQNVIFSEFLITLTIAASVWLPYIWGKIAILILANPVGFFVRMPLFLVSKVADFALDLLIFVAGLAALALTSVLRASVALVGGQSVVGKIPEFLNTMSSNMTKSSGTRLEGSLAFAIVGLKPDLPTFSLRSHHALRILKQQLQTTWINIEQFTNLLRDSPRFNGEIFESSTVEKPELQQLSATLKNLPKYMADRIVNIAACIQKSFINSEGKPTTALQDIDVDLVRWNAQDKFLAILLGYVFFAWIGYLYLKVARIFHGLQKGEKIEGIFADSLRQAGGVVKVVIIIGIEMILFPLYCGLLLDAALLPLFENVSLESRIAFIMRAPLTGLFVHWFVGTCYMFHFALFVSMCRKIFRKGVLYFIRDPDDPTFHPVRDVLERPVLTQLGKIAFSGFIYGGLVYLCLGGVVYLLSQARGVLPIHWSSNQPHQSFPVDVVFYNFSLPFILRQTRPSKKVADMYEWWFRLCARELRLSNFLFGEEREEERGFHTGSSLWSKMLKGNQDASVEEAANWIETGSKSAGPFVKDGGYARAPASDSVRIPKGNRVFLEVSEKNERLDGQEDKETGMHGSKDDRFTVVYIPPHFRARITTFVFLLWAFASMTGVTFTIGPLLIGRLIIQPLVSDGLPANDLYAFTVGIHLCGAAAYAIAYFGQARAWITESTSSIRAGITSYLYPLAKYLLGLFYVGTAACVLPVLFSLLAELYIHVPIYGYLETKSESEALPESGVASLISLPPTIFLLQTWTVGLVLVKVILREGFGDPETSQAARALRAITRRGYLDPDVGLATRALFIPALLLASMLGLAPLALGRMVNSFLDVQDEKQRVAVYRYCFPGVAVMMVMVYILLSLKRRIAIWRTKIRDEVYLIGEKLHNYQETSQSGNHNSRDKGKGKVKDRVRNERVHV